MSDNIGLLAHTERFLRAKRNLLFWLGATLLVECTHTNQPISPQIFGASLSISPRVLTSVMLFVSSYHAIGFYYEASIVRLKNNVLTRGKGINSPDSILDSRLSQIEAVMEPLPASLEAAQQALSSIYTDVADLEANDVRISQSIGDITFKLRHLSSLYEMPSIRTDPDGVYLYRNATGEALKSMNALNQAQSYFEQRRVRSEPIYNALQGLEKLEIIKGDLSRLVRDNIHDLTRWHATISGGEKAMFRWYDTIAPSALLILATSIWLYDLSPLPPPSTLLKALGA